MLATIFDKTHITVWRLLPFLAVFAFVCLILFQLGFSDTHSYIGGLIVCLFAFVFGNLLVKGDLVERISSVVIQFNMSLSYILILGLLIRLVWYLVFPITPMSDSATYLSLANGLINSKEYFVSDTFAYWPPGFPLFLFITHLGLFEITSFSIACINVMLYLLSSYFLYRLACKICNEKSALFAVLGLAIWPNNFSFIGIPFKEYLVFTLLLIATFVYVSSTRFSLRLLVGVLLGACTLTQPGTVLFLSVFIVSSWYLKEKTKLQLLSIAAYVLGIVLVVGPWTYRNLQVFDEFVLISTNGGSNLYRANNELAEGGYMPEGKIVLQGLTEVEENSQYKALALKWITENPIDFIQLSFRKMVLFMGDDSTGVFVSMKAFTLSPSNEKFYYAAKLLSTLFWLMLWAIIFLRFDRLKLAFARKPRLVVVSLGFLYFFTVHSVFESNSKYHFPASWALLLICSTVLVGNKLKPINRA